MRLVRFLFWVGVFVLATAVCWVLDLAERRKAREVKP